MAEEAQQQDSSKTLVAFVVGLLIGGMLVWAFSGPNADAPQTEINNEAAEVNEETENNEANNDGQGSEGGGETTEAEPAIEAPSLEVGDGAVEVQDQAAGMSVTLDRATYPIEEGWIGVRDYNNGQLSFIKGVVRFSAAAGLVPQEIVLQVPTQPGREYAVVMFSEDGNNTFNPAGDVQIDEVFATFTAE
jgi:hypothetical protein